MAQSRVTKNQVYFSQRGQTHVGWIHRSTPTRYQIWYEDRGKKRLVWRRKNRVSFVRDGRRARAVNPDPSEIGSRVSYVDDFGTVLTGQIVRVSELGNYYIVETDPKWKKKGRPFTRYVYRQPNQIEILKPATKSRANPSAAVHLAADLSRRFYGFDPRHLKMIDLKWPKALTHLGQCSAVNYISDKFDGKVREYVHDFDGKVHLFAGAPSQRKGKNMLIIIGNFGLTEKGIT